ncbi:hypothetical protein PIB30_078916 [Stylosanthes scabra]|uniref:Uncharacterized protein n=1 Tax=Stylosanthes scabra TaxID=79078 RepID=A0ABU6SSW9_9FABA|nr:hypothetical protein [Stylosanthes scabra]
MKNSSKRKIDEVSMSIENGSNFPNQLDNSIEHNISDVPVTSILVVQQEHDAESIKKYVLTEEIATLVQNIDALRHEHSSLLLEQNKLKLQMAIIERENTLQEESESILNQFSTVHRRLPVAITFDPELRLTHRLRLRGAYYLLFASNLGLRIGRARSSLVNLWKTMRLMVVLGCSKSGGTAFGIPLSVGIQDLRKWVFGQALASRNLGLNGFESGFKEKDLKHNCSRALENRFYLQQSRFSEPFSKKNEISRVKNRFP